MYSGGSLRRKKKKAHVSKATILTGDGEVTSPLERLDNLIRGEAIPVTNVATTSRHPPPSPSPPPPRTSHPLVPPSTIRGKLTSACECSLCFIPNPNPY